jgi:helix-turn-helix, Psq domain/Tc5 transposase DNA-binding domain
MGDTVVSDSSNVLQPHENIIFDVSALDKPQRIALAHQAWKESKGQLSMRKAATKFGVSYSTLQDRIKNGAISKAEANQAMQRLSVREEQALRGWVLQVETSGDSPRIDQLRDVATVILRAKGDTKELGVHWTDSFFRRHPDLKAKVNNRQQRSQTQILERTGQGNSQSKQRLRREIQKGNCVCGGCTCGANNIDEMLPASST